MRSRERERTGNWVTLVGHGRRPAAAFAAGFGRLPHFILHEETDIARHLAKRSSHHSTSADQRRELIALSVPRRLERVAKSKLVTQSLSYWNSAFAKRRQCAAGSPELQYGGSMKTVLETLPSPTN